MKKVLDVGQCAPDHASIRRFLDRHFDCQISQTDGLDDTLAVLSDGPFDLVLVNRKLDADYSDGIEIIRRIKAEPDLTAIPVMLVSNYADHQEAAMKLGAIRGFGKLEFDQPEVVERVRAVLGK